MTHWQSYVEDRNAETHTVVGNVQVLKELLSPQLGNRRDVFVYLPPSYTQTEQRYSVIYMHDGQNLFDAATSFAGEWQVDETMEALSHEGLEAIVVGIPNMGARRLDEYGPFRDPQRGGGQGEQYLAFIVETLKPLIDRDFRTYPDRAHTGILGSSMGGLISLYAFFRYPEVFGFVGALSPSLWFADAAILPYLRQAPFTPGRIYLDVGTGEWGRTPGDHLLLYAFSRRLARFRRTRILLVQKGYQPGRDLLYVEELRALHHETAWARRLPGALRFLLGGIIPHGRARHGAWVVA
jgi:predicted alpha/beta superfamily hydrolase